MKKLLCVLMFGMMFGYTEMTTRIYELNDVILDVYWECADPITIFELTGEDLDYGYVTTYKLNMGDAPTGVFLRMHIYQHEFFGSEWEEVGYYSGSAFDSGALMNQTYAPVGFTSSEDIICPMLNLGSFVNEEDYPLPGTLTIAVTAPFPPDTSGDTGDGDMNGDGAYDVLDVVALVNCVLAATCG